jgi:predicted alpha-1,2-mannosidase
MVQHLNKGLFFVLINAVLMVPAYAQKKEPVDYADPLLGTSESRWMLNPGATMPFGMVQLSPDNQGDVWKSGYEYSLNNIGGFSHIHSWTMVGLSVMPTVGLLSTYRGPADAPTTGWISGYRSRIDKSSEVASPGYYGITLLNGNIRTEITSNTRSGFFRFTYPESHDEAHILLDLDIPGEAKTDILDAKITRVSDTEIEGYSHQKWSWNEYTVHFVVRFNKPMKSFGGWKGDKVQKAIQEIAGKGRVGAFADFKVKAGETILMQTGISLVSIENARLNLKTEMDPFKWSFDGVRKNARAVWNGMLSKIKVEGGTEVDKKKFYSNFYRSYVARTTWSDVNGQYVDVNEKIRQASSPIYGSDALWNTFWNLNQLWGLLIQT